MIAKKRIMYNLFGRHSVSKMGIIALMIIAALLIVPGGHSENYASAAPIVPDTTINVNTLPGILPAGVTWTAGTNTLAFDSTTTTSVYQLSGVRNPLNVTVTSGGGTIKLLLSDLAMTGNITITGNLALYLQNTNTISGSILATAGNSVTIDSAADPDTGSASGTLNVTVQGNNANAAIGGSTTTRNAGTITIKGGTVTATGGSVTAANSGAGAGIGGAGNINAAGGNGGTITISGGRVTATGGNGTTGAGAGIGGGATAGNGAYAGGNGGTIRIEGANTAVIARGGINTGGIQLGGAGIGGGASGGAGIFGTVNTTNTGGNGGDITINGAYVEAYGGTRSEATGTTTYELGGAGIGGGASTGRGGQGANVTISGDAVVKAYGGKITLRTNVANAEGGAAIGGGCSGPISGAAGGTVRIGDNAVVEAYGGDVVTATAPAYSMGGANVSIRAGTGIGGGNACAGNKGGAGGNITIEGNATVTATGGNAQLSSATGADHYVRAATGIGGGTGAPGGDNNTINITGGRVVAIGGDAIRLSSVNFTRVSAGTGIGAGSGSHTEGGFGAGGIINILGGTVIAEGGKYSNAATAADESQHGAGIGGGGQNYGNQPGTVGSNAIITLGAAANITAFAYGDDRPAIHGVINTTTGYVNARLADRAASAISPDHVAILLCEIQILDPDSTQLDVLSTLEYTNRAGYRSFAFQLPNTPVGQGYNIYIVGPDGAARLGRVSPDSTVIPTVSGNTGYGAYGNDTNYKGAAPVYIPVERLAAVWERHIDEGYLPVIEELKDSSGKILKENRFTIVQNDGWYIAAKPFIDGYIYEGYFMTVNDRPTNLNDFLHGYPPRIDPVRGLNTIYFAYIKSPYWADIDLANGDGSLTDPARSSYYTYDPGTRTLTIIRIAPTTPETPLSYRLWQSDTPLVDTIVVNGISVDVTLDGIAVKDMILDSAADLALYIRKDSTFNGSILVPAGAALTIDRSTLAGLRVYNTLTVTATDPGKAGIGGGNGSSGGTIAINGGNVNATGNGGGAGIGGGNGGSGGTIAINGGVVTAIGGSAGGAGIGGGNGGGGAALAISRSADVRAYSVSPESGKTAIDAVSVSGSGYYVNAFFVSRSGVPDLMDVYESGVLKATINNMPAGYRGFAFQIKDTIGPTTYSIMGKKGAATIPVRHDDEGDTNIVSVNSPSGYAGHNPLNGALPVGLGYYITEYYVKEDGSAIPVISETKTFVADGTYSKAVPDLIQYGYSAAGYQWTTAPTGPGTYTVLMTVDLTLVTSDMTMYFVYVPTQYLEIDLFNSDTSLFGTVADAWASYYEYTGSQTLGGGGTLAVKQNAPDGKQYRICMTGTGDSHYVDVISVNAGTTTAIVIDGIELTGSVELKPSSNVTLLLNGANAINGSICVPYGSGANNASITIDSASASGSTVGSLTVTAASYDAGIGGKSGTSVDAGSITISGGTLNVTGGARAAGIGGGGGGSGSTITVNGGNVTAAGGGTGAGIGGGGGYGTNAGGAGGTIIIAGNATVTAYGLNGPAIGGGNAEGTSSPGAPAAITIASTATVTAYSDHYADGALQGRLPAIYAGSNSGSGFYVNAMLEEEISATVARTLEVYDEYDTLLTTLTVPAGYRSFAFQLSGSSSQNDHFIFAVNEAEKTPVLRLADYEAEIFSVNQTTGYDGYDNFMGALPVTLRPKWNVTFDANGGTPVPAAQVVPHGLFATEPSSPAKDYYLFAGWYSDAALSNAWTFSTDPVTSDITLYAKWDMDPSMWFSVTLDPSLTGGTIQWSLTGSGSDWAAFTNDGGVYKEWFKISQISGTPTLVHLNAAADAGKAFLRWSADIPFYVSNPYVYDGESDITAGAEFTASEWFEATLAASPAGAAGADLTFAITRTPAGSATPVTTPGTFSVTGPFRVAVDEELEITAGSVAGYGFFLWQDDLTPANTVHSAGSTGTPVLSLYAGLGSVTFTAIYYDLSSQTLVTLKAYPGALAPEFTMIQSGNPVLYDEVANTRVFVVDIGTPFFATAPPTCDNSASVTYTLLGWSGKEKGNDTLTATVAGPETFTAIYYDTITQVLVTIGSYPASLDPAYTVSQNSADIPFVLPTAGTGRIFAVDMDSAFSMTVPPVTGYAFQFWMDGKVTDNPRTIAANTLTADAAYTAYFKSTDPNDLTTLNAVASPPAAGTFTYTLEGFDMGTYASGTTFNKIDAVTVTAVASGGYNFVEWLNDHSNNATATPDITGGGVVTITAYFLDNDPANRSTITLAASPAAAGTFTWSLPGMNVPKAYSSPLVVNKIDDLTVIAAAAPGFTFRFWDDTSTAMTRHVGPQSANATYTAYFLNNNPANRSTITLAAYPAASGTFTWSLPGMGTQMTYSLPFEVNKTDNLTISAAAESGFAFRFWFNGPSTPSWNVGPQSANATYAAYFLSTDPNGLTTLNVVASPAGAGTFTYTLDGFAMGVYVSPKVFNKADAVTVTAAPNAGYNFDKWLESGNTLATEIPNINADVPSVTITASFLPIVHEDKYYYITATADPRSTISPKGTVTILAGSNQTFAFSAAPGHAISAVVVDGEPLSAVQAASGSYTFYGVLANHTIDVKSREQRTDITLRIDIVEGKGYAEYRMNTDPFVRYTGVVTLDEFCSLDVMAYAADGYKFVKWVDGSNVYTTPDKSFNDIGASIELELYFDDGSGSGFSWCWIILLIVLLILLIFLIWFLFFYKRRYNVVKVSSSAVIVGKDKVRRKSAYRFSIEGGTGTVSYRIGEDGAWKTLIPGPSGDYLIPKGEITDTLIIECR